mgnify:CR=1 FL=1
MNFINRLAFAAAAIICMSATVGCQKQEEFLKRNTKSLDFSYVASSETFTVRATGDWYISDAPGTNAWTGVYDWVSVDKQSGTGDGITYEYVTVSCAQNTAEERTATIYLQGSGQSDVAITITQANGIFEFTTFGNGQAFEVSSALHVGVASEASILIPYLKALGTETYNIKVTMDGGEGLSPVDDDFSITAAGDGNIEVPLEGTPTTQGAVTFTVTATPAGDASGEPVELGNYTTIVRSGSDDEPLVFQDFNKLPWGGDCIAGVAGVWPADRTVANITSLDVPTETCVVGENGLGSGVTSTIRSSNAALFNLLGMTGWTGYTNYMRPGYIQLGTASLNTLGQPGSLISPEFNIPAGVTDLLLTVKLATWTAHHDKVEVGITPKHDGVYTKKNEDNYNSRYAKADCRAYADVSDITYNTWIEYSFVLPCEGLSSPKSVYITIPEECWNADGSVNAGRIYVDDIKLVY